MCCAADDPNAIEIAVQVVGVRQAEGYNVYATFNRIDAPPSGSAADADVSRRTLLFLDSDPVRPANTSATDAQRAAAAVFDESLVEWIKERTGVGPVRRDDSGNGRASYSLMDLPAADARVEELLKRLAAARNTDVVHLDTSVFNASRISRVAGTINLQGDVHRLCRTVELNADARVLTAEMLDRLIAELPPVEKTQGAKKSRARKATASQAEHEATGAKSGPAAAGADADQWAELIAAADRGEPVTIDGRTYTRQERLDRALAYLRAIPADDLSRSGRHGSDDRHDDVCLVDVSALDACDRR
jgi:hypothetical protein